MKTFAIVLLLGLLLVGVLASATMTTTQAQAQVPPTATLRTFDSVYEAWQAARRGEITPIHGVAPATYTPVPVQDVVAPAATEPATVADLVSEMTRLLWRVLLEFIP